MPSSRHTRSTSWLVAVAIVLFISTGMLILTPDLWHWMIVPTMMAGVLIGVDAADWLLRRSDVLEPRALVGLFGLHFFFVAPLLHVCWDYWPKYVPPAADWRVSLGELSLLNVGGLLLYRIIVSLPARRLPKPRISIDSETFKTAATMAVALSMLLYAFTILRFGGPAAYLRIITSDRTELDNSGWLLLLGEAWPLLLFSLVVVRKRHWLRTHTLVYAGLIVAFVLAQFLTGGLRGSRSNTIWPTLIALGIGHLMVAELRRRALAGGAIVLFVFMYVYGLYKGAGAQVVQVLDGRATTSSVSEETGRSAELLLLEDFGRAGTQALVVDRRTTDGAPSLAFGLGYAGDIAKLLPLPIDTSKLPDKVDLGTAHLYGSGSLSGDWRSSRIYGLVGEGIMNFGMMGGIAAFVPFAFFMRFVTSRYIIARTSSELTWKLLAPAGGITAILVLGSDLDNVLWFLIKQVLPLAMVVWVSRRALQRKPSGLETEGDLVASASSHDTHASKASNHAG